MPPAPALADLPWTRDGLDDIEQKALRNLQTLESEHLAVAQAVLRYPWVADDITEDELGALAHLTSIIGRTGGFYSQVSRILADTPWLADGITTKEMLILSEVSAYWDSSRFWAALQTKQLTPSYALRPTAVPTTAPPSSGSEFAWAKDGLTPLEQEALGFLQTIKTKHPDVTSRVLELPWLSDGITWGEVVALCHVSTINDSGRAFAVALTYSRSNPLPPCSASETGAASQPTATPGPTSAPASGPTLDVVARSGGPGVMLMISGADLPALANISNIAVGNLSLGPAVPTDTDGQGGFRMAIFAPQLDPGAHILSVTVGGMTITATFTVS